MKEWISIWLCFRFYHFIRSVEKFGSTFELNLTSFHVRWEQIIQQPSDRRLYSLTLRHHSGLIRISIVEGGLFAVKEGIKNYTKLFDRPNI